MDQPKIGVDDLHTIIAAPGDETSNLTIQLVNMLSEGCRELRRPECSPDIESVLIAAATVYAGCLHGELLALGTVADIDDEALRTMLVNNFRTGQAAGEAKVQRATKHVVDEAMAEAGQSQTS